MQVSLSQFIGLAPYPDCPPPALNDVAASLAAPAVSGPGAGTLPVVSLRDRVVNPLCTGRQGFSMARYGGELRVDFERELLTLCDGPLDAPDALPRGSVRVAGLMDGSCIWLSQVASRGCQS